MKLEYINELSIKNIFKCLWYWSPKNPIWIIWYEPAPIDDIKWIDLINKTDESFYDSLKNWEWNNWFYSINFKSFLIDNNEDIPSIKKDKYWRTYFRFVNFLLTWNKEDIRLKDIHNKQLDLINKNTFLLDMYPMPCKKEDDFESTYETCRWKFYNLYSDWLNERFKMIESIFIEKLHHDKIIIFSWIDKKNRFNEISKFCFKKIYYENHDYDKKLKKFWLCTNDLKQIKSNEENMIDFYISEDCLTLWIKTWVHPSYFKYDDKLDSIVKIIERMTKK